MLQIIDLEENWPRMITT